MNTISYWNDCINSNNNPLVSVFVNGSSRKLCGTLQISSGLTQDDQVYSVFPCPGGCPKGIHPDDRFSTCAKKIIKGFRNLGFKIVTRAWSKSRNVTEIITTAPLSNQITGFMKHYATEIATTVRGFSGTSSMNLINKKRHGALLLCNPSICGLKSIRKGTGKITPAPVGSQVSVF
eukprot:sb/3471920/